MDQMERAGAGIELTPSDDERPPDEERPAADRAHRKHSRRRVRRAIAVIIVILVIPVGWSYTRALTAPGSAPWGARTVEWVKDHGGRGLVLVAERVWYSIHKPSVGGTPANGLPYAPAPSAHPRRSGPKAPPHLSPPPDIRPIAPNPLPNEGVWQPTGRVIDGIPAIYTAFLRPDPIHTSLVSGVAWMDTKLLRGVLVGGTQNPGGSWRWGAEVPMPERANLAATFNSGFLMKDARSGYYSEGKTVVPLVDGAASLVVFKDGTMTVGKWGRDVSMGPTVASVRQNLWLIVDNGTPVPGLATDPSSMWGATLGNSYLVWRSGVGVDANGGLIYAAGDGLTADSLANLLARAGAVRAMELDINSEWVTFSYYTPAPASTYGIAGHHLLPDMTRSPDRYLVPDERDFFAMFLRPGVVAHGGGGSAGSGSGGRAH